MMATPGSAAGQKRKANSQPASRNIPKRRKTEIPVQDGVPGGLNINNFVKAREFEINALETSMQKSRKSLMARAFQQLPRHMRRRTASHNVKKIPKRLRKRAEQEMKADNTPIVTRRTRPISRKLRLRLETAKLLKRANQRSKTVRQKKKDAKANAKEPDPEKHADVSRLPRIKKNKLADPPRATSKYKRRQVHKTWLPTHLWHSKRARMTRPTEPLWRMAIPLAPTEKSYRPSHRASTARGCIAWDTSYMSTVGCLGTDHTLDNMLKLLGFVFDGKASQKRKWQAGTRHAKGWICEVDSEKKPIVPANVIWMVREALEEQATNMPTKSTGTDEADCDGPSATTRRRQKTRLDRRLFIRLHPSAFQYFWLELLKAAKMQKPQVLVEDLRFEIGSIEVTGPGSTEALLGVLKPRHAPAEGSVEAVWAALAGLSHPASLPDSPLLAFAAIDPRLTHPPKQVQLPNDQAGFDKLNELTTSWPVDNIQGTPQLSSHKARWSASTNMPSQKAISRRRTEAGKGRPVPVIEKDAAIPIILLANRSQAHDANAHGSWTVLLPWCCTDAVWRSLMYYPLSSGQTPRFGGLAQMQQIAFEHMTPWYPADFPGIESGKAWERTQSKERFDEWLRRPPSRRMRWDLVELGLGRRGEVGRGWTCDWEYLIIDTDKPQDLPTRQALKDEAVQSKTADKTSASRKKSNRGKNETNTNAPTEPDRRRNTSSPESDADPERSSRPGEPVVTFSQLTPSQASSVIKFPLSKALPPAPILATVRIRLLTRGTPNPAARIYRIPLSRTAGASPKSSTNETQSSTGPVNSNGTTSTESAPPPGQPSPPTPIISTTQSSTTTFTNLREKWLSLLPTHLPPSNQRALPKHLKQQYNHRALPSKHVVHPYDPPHHINVLPRNAPQSIIEEFGRKPLTTEEFQEQQREALMKELMKNEIGPGKEWDATKGLVECPNPEDLIGFVTSGSFNLGEGSGTAIGGIWVQRVLQGWRNEQAGIYVEAAEPQDSASIVDSNCVANASGRASKPHRKPKSTMNGRTKKTIEWERCLCVVRNTGESVGRLGVWELCE